MAEERLERQPDPITLVCSEGEVDIRIGEFFNLFGTDGFRLEGVTGERLRAAGDRKTPVLSVSTEKPLVDWSLPNMGRSKGRYFYEVTGDSVAASILKQKEKAQL